MFVDKTISEEVLRIADQHPIHGRFGRSYYPKLFDNRAAVASEKAGSAIIASSGPEGIDFYGAPALIIGSDVDAIGGLIDGLPRGKVRAICASDIDLQKIGFHSSPRHSLVADLRGGETELHRGLRKSFRSLVNWGRKNIRQVFVNRDNPDQTAFGEYQDLHARVSGRQTRPQSSWDAMFQWIAQGGGELALGYMDTIGLVASTLVVDGTEASFYASGAYDRDHFDKPLSHWPVYSAMLRSADRGMKFFDFGTLPDAEAPKKERDIAHFKRGFSANVETRPDWIRQ